MSSVSPDDLLLPFLRMPAPWPAFAVAALASSSSARRVSVIDAQQLVVNLLEARDYYCPPGGARSNKAPKVLREAINLAVRAAIKSGRLPRDGVIIVERFTEPAREFRNNAVVHAGRHVHWTECLSVVAVWAWFSECVLGEQLGAPSHEQLLSIISLATRVERSAGANGRALALLPGRDDAPREIVLARPLAPIVPHTFDIMAAVLAAMETAETASVGVLPREDGVWVLLGGGVEHLHEGEWANGRGDATSLGVDVESRPRGYGHRLVSVAAGIPLLLVALGAGLGLLVLLHEMATPVNVAPREAPSAGSATEAPIGPVPRVWTLDRTLAATPTPDGSIVSVGTDGSVKQHRFNSSSAVWDVSLIGIAALDASVDGLAYRVDTNGRVAEAKDGRSEILLYSPQDGSHRMVPLRGSKRWDFFPHRDSTHMLLASSGEIRLWDYVNHRLVVRYSVPASYTKNGDLRFLTSVVATPTGDAFAYALYGDGGDAGVWFVSNGSRRRLSANGDLSPVLAISTDRRFLVEIDGRATRIYDTNSTELVGEVSLALRVGSAVWVDAPSEVVLVGIRSTNEDGQVQSLVSERYEIPSGHILDRFVADPACSIASGETSPQDRSFIVGPVRGEEALYMICGVRPVAIP
jgi:hypothetical protein